MRIARHSHGARSPLCRSVDSDDETESAILFQPRKLCPVIIIVGSGRTGKILSTITGAVIARNVAAMMTTTMMKMMMIKAAASTENLFRFLP
jgi:hypothetical protein